MQSKFRSKQSVSNKWQIFSLNLPYVCLILISWLHSVFHALEKGKAAIMEQITFLVAPTSTKVMQIIAEAYKSQEWHEKFCCYLSAYEIASTTPPLTV